MHLQDMNDNETLMGGDRDIKRSAACDPDRTYDDPCELLDESGVATGRGIPRSRSWLCCPQRNASTGNGASNGQGNVTLPCRYSSLQPVTVPPRPQEHLHLAAMSALKAEVLDLSAQLQICSRERDRLQTKLKIEQEERSRAQVRLEALGTAHEGRLTELHCVIAELSRKLHQRQQAAIMEEEAEADISEIESSSVCDANETDTNKDESDIEEVKATRSATESPSVQNRPEFTASILSHQQFLSPLMTKSQTQPSATQVAALQEEILSLRQEVAHLQAKLATKRNYESSCQEYVEDSACDNEKSTDNSIKRSNTYTSEHDLDETLPLGRLTGTLNDISCIDNQSVSDKNEFALIHDNSKTTNVEDVNKMEKDCAADTVNDYEINGSNMDKRSVNNVQQQRPTHAKSNSLVLQINRSSSPVHVHSSLGRSGNVAPVSKMAERVRLRRTTDEKHITGTDILNTGVCTTEVAEHLVSDLRNQSGLHESYLLTDTLNGSISSTPSEVLRLELELERTIAQLEHLKANNTVLTLTLQESKAHCDSEENAFTHAMLRCLPDSIIIIPS
ncbi:colorectal mutant cancer protein-like [Ctenocephalides felis]|uniref:colorectal mutant cancer protein-like n=1 Tax=Ctenocephalides felis TaxID=7515 RepID=UPI000E6E2256|nr:colorectal mutant cancer protein-like [Ctenocephalides felis]